MASASFPFTENSGVKPLDGKQGVADFSDSESLLAIDAERFRAHFDRDPFIIRHRLVGHELFSLPRLIELARRLPEDNVEYNAGNLPVSQDPDTTPRTGLSVEETIRRIEECNSWLVLKFVDQDPEYRELLYGCLDEVALHSEPLAPNMYSRHGFIFISSPGSVTPYHMDPEYNFLLQIRGRKTVSMLSREDGSVVTEQEFERYYSGGHRNMKFREDYLEKARVSEIGPGDGLHFPVTWPHWVVNGPEVSISFSITFLNSATERRRALYTANHYLRKWGMKPAPVGHSAVRDEVKYFGLRAARRIGRLFQK